MKAFLPTAFIVLAAAALLFAISFVWSSLRAIFGGAPDHDITQSEAMKRRSELLHEKDAVLRSLKDLEFERAVGKISEQDFARLDAEFRGRAKVLLKQLDQDLKEHREKARVLLARELPEQAPSSEKSS